MTRLLPAIALTAALFLPPAPTAADTRFARLSRPGIVAVVRHALAPGTGDSVMLATTAGRARVAEPVNEASCVDGGGNVLIFT